uniref:hypothetical protein n=1 Tax=Streptomyces sp. NBC_01562 TaxID=2975879 RepID=UPI002F911162
MEFVGETLRAALEALDAAVPALLSPLVTPDRVKRYGGPDRLLPLPKGDNVRQGEDADWLESLLSFEQAGCSHCDSAVLPQRRKTVVPHGGFGSCGPHPVQKGISAATPSAPGAPTTWPWGKVRGHLGPLTTLSAIV